MKVRYFGLILMIIILLTGCSMPGYSANNTAPQEKDLSPEEQEKVLYENGMDIINTMVEMAGSDIYQSVLGVYDGSKKIIDKAALGEYTQPKCVYEIRFTAPMVDNLGVLLRKEVPEYDELSDVIKEQLEKKIAGSFVTMINAIQGADTIAASSVIQAGECFVCKGMVEKRAYLYLFEEGYPIVVSYVPGKDGAVSANGMFLLKDMSIEELKEILGYGTAQGAGVEIKEIKVN